MKIALALVLGSKESTLVLVLNTNLQMYMLLKVLLALVNYALLKLRLV